MTKSSESSLNPNVTPFVPWWSRPMTGSGSILQELLARFKISKPEVPESVWLIHNGEMIDARVFAQTAQALDNDKFSSQEFLLFAKIKYCLARQIDEYAGLEASLQLLQAAVEAKNSFLTIDQTELRYRSSKQQEFYQYIESILVDYEDKVAFKANVEKKLTETLPHVKTEEGKRALQEYQKELDNLCEYEFGLKLLSLFKTYQLADYSILRTISDIVSNFREKNTIDYKGLVALVISKYSVFEKLKDIIGISDEKSNPDTYARMLQFISLSYRQKNSYAKFKELLQVLRKWHQFYQAIQGIRGQYPVSDFSRPTQFSEPIPGIEIYEKYKRAFTDSKTGLTYIDFGEN